MNRIKNDQQARVDNLKKDQELSIYRTQLLQKHLNECQAILEIIQAMVNAGLSWTEIWRMIKEEKRVGNPLANLILNINFEK